jgi:hypothetical protein
MARTKTQLEQMKAMAALESHVMRRHVAGGSDGGQSKPHQQRVAIRAKVLCASCDRYLSHDQVTIYRQTKTCGRTACHIRIDRWKRYTSLKAKSAVN